MNLKIKPFNFGFSVLMPEANFGLFKSTTNSIKSNYPDVPFICVISKGTNRDCIEEMEKVCPVYVGDNMLGSLINTAINKGHKEWNFLINAGCILPKRIHDKFSIFMESEKDVLFPIFVQYDQQGRPFKLNANFIEATLNGTLIHKKAFDDIGKFTEDCNIEGSKTLWYINAVEKGYNFKAILGAKIC